MSILKLPFRIALNSGMVSACAGEDSASVFAFFLPFLRPLGLGGLIGSAVLGAMLRPIGKNP
eukprot:scaffold620036_cov38-Prasinocladus_malaysianus.AAC.1